MDLWVLIGIAIACWAFAFYFVFGNPLNWDWVFTLKCIIEQARRREGRAELRRWRPIWRDAIALEHQDISPEKDLCASCGRPTDGMTADWPYGKKSYPFCEGCDNLSWFESRAYSAYAYFRGNKGKALLVALVIVFAIYYFSAGAPSDTYGFESGPCCGLRG
jgi:hypothetical protein